MDNKQLKTLIVSHTRQTVQGVAYKLGVHYTTVSCHLQAIECINALDKWVLHDLADTVCGMS